MYSSKVCEIAINDGVDGIVGSISYLKKKEKEFLVFLLKNKLYEFTPVEVSKQIGVTSKTVINRCAKLAANGFVTPNLVKERITSYSLSEFTKANEKILIDMIEG